MSTAYDGTTEEELFGVEGREWGGSAFAPEALRYFSILPPEDADEGYCVRHKRDMQALDPVIHRDGALYTTADGWHVYSCQHCRRELGRLSTALYRRALARAFAEWDDPEGDVLGDAFQYLCEGTAEDVAGRGWP